MEKREITKEYSNDDISIAWKPSLCIHAAECVKRLPQVYNPNEKPWIKIENGKTEDLIEQVNACPSGALTYYRKDVSKDQQKGSSVNIEITENGPLLIKGTVTLIDHKGETTRKEKVTALCRCGASTNKPYCDGTHNKIEFNGE